MKVEYQDSSGVFKTLEMEAKHISIEDIAGNFLAGNVEQALAEIKTLINDTPVPNPSEGGRSNYLHVEDYKTSSNTWTQAIQQAFTIAGTRVAATAKQYTTKTGSSIGDSAKIVVTLAPGEYLIESRINIPYGVNFDFTGCVFISSDPVQIANYDCLFMLNNCYRNHFKMPVFIGFRRCFVFSTANRDTSIIKIEGGGSVNCKNWIDDSSLLNSRSTMLSVSNFYHVLTDQPFRVHTDDCHIYDGWISSSGYNGSAIFSQSRLRLNNVIMIPKPMQGPDGDKACWVEAWTESNPSELVVPALGVIEDNAPEIAESKKGNVGHNNRSITIDHCVFGGESGSMPAVRWYGRTATNLNNSNALHNHITIRNCSIEVGNTSQIADKAPIVIHGDLPSGIMLEGLNGLSASSDALIKMVTDSTIHHQESQKFRYEIFIGPGVNGRNSYPITNDPTLYEFITSTVFLNQDLPNFTALREAKKSLGDSTYEPPQPPSEEPETPIESRTAIRYIRLGGVREGTDTFLPSEVEAWRDRDNLLLGNQSWTVPSGTNRNNNTYPTDGERNHLSTTLTNTNHDLLYMTFDLGQGYKDLSKINFLLYIGLKFNNVFVSVSADNSEWKEVFRASTLTHDNTYTGTDIKAPQLYD